MRTPLCRFVGVVAGALVLLPSFANRVAAGDDAPAIYVKRATWSQTMLESRQRLLQMAQAQQPGRSTGAKMQPAQLLAVSLAGEGPGQAVSVPVAGRRWLRLSTLVEEGAGNCDIWGDARLVAADGRVTWLGSLTPALVSVSWGQLHVDHNWQAQPLLIGTRHFEHGLWVHGPSTVVYALDGKYARLEAWAGIDSARPKGTARFMVSVDDADLALDVWRRAARDFPGPAQSFSVDAGRGYLAWFLSDKSTHLEQAAILHAVSLMGHAGDGLRKQLGELIRGKVPASDGRWLDLYLRACQARACHEPLERIWLIEIRRALEGQLAQLLPADVSLDDPRWNTLRATAARIAELLGRGAPIEVAALAAAPASLQSGMASRFHPAAALPEHMAALQQRLAEVLSAIAHGEPAGEASLAALATAAPAVRRELLESLAGMRDFLAVPAHTELPGEWQRQFASLQADLENRPQFAKVAAEAFRPEALIADADRDPADVVLRRTGALLDDLQRTPAAAARLAGYAKELAELRAAGGALPVTAAEARFALFADVCRLRRQIAFCNPLLNFDQIVFLKRHRAIYDHMCDQFYGIAARPGGGLYVLSNAFGPRPVVRDLLAGAVVEKGRLQGQRLSGGTPLPPAVSYDGMGHRRGDDGGGGSFLSPDLSCDARQLAFAYVECRGDPTHREHTDPERGHWSQGRCYHIFKVNMDGSHLQQLTDGTWNDFDPCWMPSGRIALTSERRGGYLRCGRVCPTYTVYDMAADGRDVRALSFHETNEWQPSVNNEGMLVYTRWDYVDRHSMVAHHPWIMTPDGCNPRALQGNYTTRATRPDMELDVRAIPGSQRYVATAAPHHGQSFGSLVVFDPRVHDDDAMSAVRRLTPEVGFPESQPPAANQVYGEAWPLSEDYYLCVYDGSMTAAAYAAGTARGTRGDYGIYLLDGFGNRELIYRDPEIGCHNPIPLVPRACPPVVSEHDPAVAGMRSDEATVSVVNVYHSSKPWPAGTRIAALRVYQVLPLSVASAATPHNTGLQIPVTYSINIARAVLGTAPVEADGSAQFVVPARRELFFQALDGDGLAVTTMRSATQFQAGEVTSCQGCHEPRQGAPTLPDTLPLALRRPPSRLAADADGTNPFSYPRLIQPVLEKHCVACHREKADKAGPLDAGLITVESRGYMDRTSVYYRSYMSLAPKWGFYAYDNPLESTPGQIGARVAPLYQLLKKGHYDVKLSPAEMHRFAVWLDSCSPFYGVYEKEGGEAQLRGEIVRPTLE